MSLNIQVVADKTNFSNHFNDVITIPANSKMALTKCEMTVPMLVQNILLVPNLTVAQRGNTAIEVFIDGITNNITWLDIYTAYAQYPDINKVEPNLNQTTFFSGEYPLFTNNKMIFQTNPPSAVRDGDRPSIFWAMAKAISNAFDFYDAVDISTWVQNGFNIGNEPEGSATLQINGAGGHLYNNCNLVVCNQPEAKLNIFYNAHKVAIKTPDVGVHTAFDMKNWTQPVLGKIINASGQPCLSAQRWDIDYNGGYIRTQVNLDNTNNSARCCFGYNLSGRGSGDDKMSVEEASAIFRPELIDIGVDFHWETATVPAQTQGLFRIIDGGYFDGGTYFPNFVPDIKIKRFNNNSDFFYILGQRSNPTNGNPSQIIFQLYQGGNQDITLDTLVYTFKTRIDCVGMTLQSVFMSDSSANEFINIAYTPLQTDTLTQSDIAFQGGSAFVDTVRIQPLTTVDYGLSNSSVINFWGALGIGGYSKSSAVPSLQRNTYLLQNEGTPLNKVLSWATNYKDEDSSNTNTSYYWFGKRNIRDFFRYSVANSGVGNERWNANLLTSLTYMPKHLNCYVNNLDLKNYQGSYASLSGAESQTGITRLVSTIPLPQYETSISQDIEIEYEVFSPYYRPLSNPNIFTINQLLVEISFKDFETDQRETIDAVKGLVRCEFNIMNGTAKSSISKKMEQDLLPFI